MTIKPNFPNSVEITDEAFHLLIGNDEKSWRDYNSNDKSEWTLYHRQGVKLLAICNFVSGVTQYYIQDINSYDSIDLPTLKNVHPEFIQAKERLIKSCQ